MRLRRHTCSNSPSRDTSTCLPFVCMFVDLKTIRHTLVVQQLRQIQGFNIFRAQRSDVANLRFKIPRLEACGRKLFEEGTLVLLFRPCVARRRVQVKDPERARWHPPYPLLASRCKRSYCLLHTGMKVRNSWSWCPRRGPWSWSPTREPEPWPLS